MKRFGALAAMAAATLLALGSAPASAQVTRIDPNSQIDSDLDTPPAAQQPDDPYRGADPSPPRYEDPSQDPARDPYPEPYQPQPAQQPYPAPGQPGQGPSTRPGSSYDMPQSAEQAGARAQATDTFQQDDLIGAAEGVFGKGAAGLAGLIENILKEQGEPNAYIAGREAGGAIAIGVRYGSGTLFHKIEGQRKVYWTGPSIGFDVGGDASNVFVLVYNLHDSQELYKRFPGGEGRVFVVGGFSATYMRRGDIVLIPVRLGVGWRLGVNAGYMNFTEKKRWLPF
ncbi:DUF1134 domain-containing protein [Sphingomonas sp. HF-S3]|uniref:DUF1134 domain-containing protein n=1 Tax=Sphingomonas rustica TaxID=3103142 RepID=A0ABV0B3B3_9SPHN